MQDDKLDDIDAMVEYYQHRIDALIAYKQLLSRGYDWQLTAVSPNKLHYAWGDGNRSLCGKVLDLEKTATDRLRDTRRRCSMCVGLMIDKGIYDANAS